MNYRITGSSALWTFYEQVFEPLFLRSRSPRSKYLYRTTLKNFERFLCRKAMLPDLNDETVGCYLNWYLQQDGGRSPYSANKERANLLAIWRFAFRRKGTDGAMLIDSWPNVAAEKEPREVPNAWLREQLDALFSHLNKLDRTTIGRIPESLWWTALHGVLWDTGERIAAVMALTWGDIDLERACVQFRAATRKGGREGRLNMLHPDTVASLEQIESIRQPQECERVLPWPYCKTYLWRRYEQILKAAGLPSGRKSKFHRIRRSVASHAEAAGVNATELLGHSDRSVTLESYLDPRIVGVTHARDVLFRPGH